MEIKIKTLPNDVTWIDVLILKAIADNLPISISKLHHSGYLNNKQQPTLRGKELLKLIDIENPFENVSNDEYQTEDIIFNEFIEAYRAKFKGKKLGAVGDKLALKEKMIRFLKKYDYSYNHILNAIQLYINSCAKDNYLYLIQAHYTVFKKTAKEEVSVLAAFCEELEEGQQVKDISQSDDSNIEML